MYDQGDSSSVHHVDKEWRYVDLGLSTRFSGPTLDVRFQLKSDDEDNVRIFRSLGSLTDHIAQHRTK